MTYGDLKAAIVFTCNRDDLTDVIDDAVAVTITRLQRDFFYSTPKTEYIYTVPGQVFYDVPADLVSIQYMRLLNPPNFHLDGTGAFVADNGNWQTMIKCEYDRLLLMDTTVPVPLSIPSIYAPYDNQIRIFQAPDKVYPLELTGNGKIAIPADDTVSNFWTEAAGSLVRYATAALIYLTRIKQPELYQSYQLQADKERISLIRETWAKSTMSQISAWW